MAVSAASNQSDGLCSFHNGLGLDNESDWLDLEDISPSSLITITFTDDVPRSRPRNIRSSYHLI